MRLEDDTGWLNVAQREGVKLNCPLCPNLFTADRSFQVETRVNWDSKYVRYLNSRDPVLLRLNKLEV